MNNTINDQVNNAYTEYGLNTSSYFSFKDNNGVNRIRVLTEAEPIATHFFGKGQKASVCYGEHKGCPFHGDKATVDEKGNESRTYSTIYIRFI